MRFICLNTRFEFRVLKQLCVMYYSQQKETPLSFRILYKLLTFLPYILFYQKQKLLLFINKNQTLF